MTDTATGTFDIVLRPGEPELEGAVARFDLAKTFHGDLEATGKGVMLSAGNPQVGEAGYVANETVDGRLGGRTGSFVLVQLGSMHAGSQALAYEVVAGSGTGELAGINGALHLDIEADGTHRYRLDFALS